MSKKNSQDTWHPWYESEQYRATFLFNNELHSEHTGNPKNNNRRACLVELLPLPLCSYRREKRGLERSGDWAHADHTKLTQDHSDTLTANPAASGNQGFLRELKDMG